jgi:PhnB protein
MADTCPTILRQCLPCYPKISCFLKEDIMAVNPVPEGYNTVTPSLIVEDAAGMLQFIEAAFGGKLQFRMDRQDGKVSHSEIMIGDTRVMVGEAAPEHPAVANGSMYMYVQDADATYRQALAAGASSISEPEVMFYGDRTAAVRDRWGVRWALATHVEDVSEEELGKRAAALGRAP